MATKWVGSAPDCCDLCNRAFTKDFVDGRTKFGPWANMCLQCHANSGVGLGMGRGQRYERREDGWYKVAG